MATHWKLKEVLQRYRVKPSELADYMGVRRNTITDLVKHEVLPKIGGDRIDAIAEAINALSKRRKKVRGIDLIFDSEKESQSNRRKNEVSDH